jgi:hypothetical protein
MRCVDDHFIEWLFINKMNKTANIIMMKNAVPVSFVY